MIGQKLVRKRHRTWFEWVIFAQFQKNSTVTTVLILKKSFNHDQNFVLLSNGNFEREVRSLVLITGTGDAGTS